MPGGRTLRSSDASANGQEEKNDMIELFIVTKMASAAPPRNEKRGEESC